MDERKLRGYIVIGLMFAGLVLMGWLMSQSSSCLDYGTGFCAR